MTRLPCCIRSVAVMLPYYYSRRNARDNFGICFTQGIIACRLIALAEKVKWSQGTLITRNSNKDHMAPITILPLLGSQPKSVASKFEIGLRIFDGGKKILGVLQSIGFTGARSLARDDLLNYQALSPEEKLASPLSADFIGAADDVPNKLEPDHDTLLSSVRTILARRHKRQREARVVEYQGLART
ncbi:hypothetical protein [Herbaspirillum sp. C7C8]|uniref:hypothetical protein n=1 Tax=Herbaspirillum sp. C7C8 TaxID=2736665 RepID=UPI001F521C45|nr:hypothetical protein [Herbaspirillum sp. C7C8]MCI1005238.1 hypothetical protein [Herbaspirillum sp. C7C8]